MPYYSSSGLIGGARPTIQPPRSTAPSGSNWTTTNYSSPGVVDNRVVDFLKGGSATGLQFTRSAPPRGGPGAFMGSKLSSAPTMRAPAPGFRAGPAPQRRFAPGPGLRSGGPPPRAASAAGPGAKGLQSPGELRAAYEKYGPGGAYDYRPGATGVAAAAGPAGAPAEFENTAYESPKIEEVYKLWKERLGKDPTERAINKSNLGVADMAALAASDLGGSMARRGVLGTGTGATFLQNKVFAPAQREAAGRAADIAMGREKDLDALTLAGLGIARAGEDVNLANRGLGLQQYLGQNQTALGWAQLKQQQQDAEMARWLALLGNENLMSGLGPNMNPGTPGNSYGMPGIGGV